MTNYSNDRNIPIRTLLGFLSLGVCVVSLSGCVSDYATNDAPEAADYHVRHPIVLAQAPTAVDVFPVGGGIDSMSVAKIRAFAERYRELGSGQITILAPSGRYEGRSYVVNEIRRTLYASGVRGYVSVGSYPVADPTLAARITRRLGRVALPAVVSVMVSPVMFFHCFICFGFWRARPFVPDSPEAYAARVKYDFFAIDWVS